MEKHWQTGFFSWVSKPRQPLRRFTTIYNVIGWWAACAITVPQITRGWQAAEENKRCDKEPHMASGITHCWSFTRFQSCYSANNEDFYYRFFFYSPVTNNSFVSALFASSNRAMTAWRGFSPNRNTSINGEWQEGSLNNKGGGGGTDNKF